MSAARRDRYVRSEHDRHRARRLQQRRHGDAGRGQDNVRRERDQFSCVFANVVDIASAPADVGPQVAAIDPAQLLSALAGTLAMRACPSGSSATKPKSTPTRRIRSGLLRARRERPRGSRAAEQRDELAPPHSITSSARASSVGGTVRPSAFAVLRLITSSYLVGACTGRSAGFSPLRMRST